jgi:hypothetical protein
MEYEKTPHQRNLFNQQGDCCHRIGLVDNNLHFAIFIDIAVWCGVIAATATA